MAIYYKVEELNVVVSTASGTGWTGPTDFQTVFTQARTSNLPVFILPGTYIVTATTLSQSSTISNNFQVYALPGTVTLQLSNTAQYLIKFDTLTNISITGIIFDGNNQTLNESSTTVSALGSALLRFTGALENVIVSNCTVTRSTQIGILNDSGAHVSIYDCMISLCNYGIASLDAQTIARSSRIMTSNNLGIYITRSSQSNDNSIIDGCVINQVAAKSGGSGQNGNGINVYQAHRVRVINNTIQNCAFSGIRVNGGNDCQVIGNNILNVTEVTLYVESPQQGINTQGGVVSNNIINGAGTGISVVNQGLFMHDGQYDGITKRVTVIGNQVYNVTQNQIGNPVLYTTSGAGIVAEGAVTVTGNNIENAATNGIILGTGIAVFNLVCTGNLIVTCPMGIGYSDGNSATGITITGNVISGYQNQTDPSNSSYPFSGAIVSTVFSSNTYRRASVSSTVANTDYGNSNDQRVGALCVGNNRAS